MMGNDIMVAPSIFVEMILSPIDSYVPYSIGRVLCVEREFPWTLAWVLAGGERFLLFMLQRTPLIVRLRRCFALILNFYPMLLKGKFVRLTDEKITL